MDFREEAFLSGFSDGLEKVAAGQEKAGIGKRIGEGIKGLLSRAGKTTGVSQTRETLGAIKSNQQRTPAEFRGGLRERARDYLNIIRGKAGSGETQAKAREGLKRLGVTAAIPGTAGVGVAAGRASKD